jgi:hypothetical protein
LIVALGPALCGGSAKVGRAELQAAGGAADHTAKAEAGKGRIAASAGGNFLLAMARKLFDGLERA